jgi:hypothetical protein
VIAVVDERLRSEARRFALRFTCAWCAWFDAERRACSHGFPAAPHRDADLQTDDTVMFCKEFEHE